MRSTFLILIAMAASSCVSSRPVHYYTIEPPPPSAGQGKPDGPSLVVGSIVTAENLQDGRIRYRKGPNEAGAYEYHRWTERPGEMIRESLVRTLRASGQYRRVLEADSSAVGDYRVRGKLYEFGEVDDATIRTKISLHLEVVDARVNRTVWDRSLEHEDPVAGKTVADVVQSLDRNLRHVVNEAAADIGAFLASENKR